MIFLMGVENEQKTDNRISFQNRILWRDQQGQAMY